MDGEESPEQERLTRIHDTLKQFSDYLKTNDKISKLLKDITESPTGVQMLKRLRQRGFNQVSQSPDESAPPENPRSSVLRNMTIAGGTAMGGPAGGMGAGIVFDAIKRLF